MRYRYLAQVVTAGVFALAALLGCGGASGGGQPGGGSSGGAAAGGGSAASGLSAQGNAASIAATFQVNVNTGNVSVISQTGTPLGTARVKPGIFTGNAVAFNSSLLTNDTLGGVGVRSLQVSMTNNTDTVIGVDPAGNITGLNVMFGAFANTTGVTSQAANTNVSTYAGSSSGYIDGATTVAKFNEPIGCAVGSDGSVYVSDYLNNRIRKIKSGYVSTLAGTGTAAEVDGVPTKAEFNGPYGLAVGPDGSVYVADWVGNRIRHISTTGVVVTIAGTGAAGNAGGVGNTATFTTPADIALDSSGNIYVSEPDSNLIRKIVLINPAAPVSSANYTVSTFAGSGTAGEVDGTGSAAELDAPQGLTADSNGNLYVADYSGNVIRMIDSNADVTTIAGTGVASDLDSYGNTATFNKPFGIAYLNGALFVSEAAGKKIREVIPIPGGSGTSSSWVVETLAGTGSTGDANGVGTSATFGDPLYLGASKSSSLYMADYTNAQVRRVNPSTGTLPIGIPTGTTSTTGDLVTLSNPNGVVDTSDLGAAPYITYNLTSGVQPGSTTKSQAWNFVIPAGVTSFQFQVMVEANTNLLLPLQVAKGAGSANVDVRTYAGNAGNKGFADGAAPNALLNVYDGFALDSQENLYVCEEWNNAIRRISSSGIVTTIAGSSRVSGNTNGAGNVATLDFPTGIAVNSAGTEIFVCDSDNNEIRYIGLTGSDPTNPADWTVSTIVGSTTAGYADGPGTTATLNSPEQICLAPDGQLFLSEYQGNRVRRLDYTGGSASSAANWNVTTIAGDNTQLNGGHGLVNAQGTVARFNYVEGLACDSAGNIYVADYGNAVIRKIDRGYNVTTYAGISTVGYTDGAGASAKFNGPTGITVDSAGYVYVADTYNDVIRRISPSQYVETVAGMSEEAGHVDGPGNIATFNEPDSVVVSPSGTLYVSTGDPTVRIIQTVQNAASGQARPR